MNEHGRGDAVQPGPDPDGARRPTRRAILQRLAQGEARVTELARPFAVSLNSVSKHIRMLERPPGAPPARRHQLSFNQQPPDAAAAWLETQRDFWTAPLDALERALRKSETQPEQGATGG